MNLHPEITFWASIITAATTLLIFAANAFYVCKFHQSVDIQRRAAQGSLLMTFHNQFFYAEPHKRIIRCLEEEKGLGSAKPTMSDEDLDDHIGLLDTIGTFTKAKLLEENLVYDIFSHYIESAYESKEIFDYVELLRRKDDSLFSDFVWIYKRMKRKEKGGGE